MKEIDFLKKFNRPKNKNYQFYNLAKRKAKKEYKCDYCYKIIKKGEIYIYYRNPRYEGLKGKPLFYETFRVCLKCFEKNLSHLKKFLEK